MQCSFKRSHFFFQKFSDKFAVFFQYFFLLAFNLFLHFPHPLHFCLHLVHNLLSLVFTVRFQVKDGGSSVQFLRHNMVFVSENCTYLFMILLWPGNYPKSICLNGRHRQFFGDPFCFFFSQPF